MAQGTDDATKWNETLAPEGFTNMHYYMFDDKLREGKN